ncbi:bi-domain-containing oxidoreductase [Candidatus Paracaedibacter symbiosus]|uniref:bi-domain-containing oxidoreductase n=1 Tax=Candidatus Paracaedibacter symbiosus TaxID=244582 RepID=UPI0005094CB4|nr:bi-domain-containing oxidoreductase [Candidatus Paracaedibacter symbiosus]
MKQVVINAGSAKIVDVPAPFVDSKSILVSVDYSCISVGTEMKSVQLSAMPLYKRALKQPDNVRKVLQSIKDNGLAATVAKVKGKLDFGSPSGYSAAGRVVAVGAEVSGFSVGDAVACAGAGIANHAEVINVPVNLAVKIPAGVDQLSASTVTLGAIAMQGVRRFNPLLGETVVVLGMGILGAITTQILKANGCQVIAVDVNDQRLKYAQTIGADVVLNPLKGEYDEKVRHYTDGYGADGVIITAASPSDVIVHQSALATRRKGRIVLVGDVGLGLRREDFYQKEIDFLISCSYGPGRYDPYYEMEGHDYPLPYVRWTENRNMSAYLSLISQGKIEIPGDNVFGIDEVKQAYQALGQGETSPLAAFLTYPRSEEERLQSSVALLNPVREGMRLAIVGASSFTQSVHLPNITRIKECGIHAVMSRTGTTATAIAQQYQATYATTDYEKILTDDKVDAVLISSPHNLHASQVLKALEAGKATFVEKPLATTHTQLQQIKNFFKERKSFPLLMTGFNRRFSPVMVMLKQHLKERQTPLIINYRMNAGFIPKDHWVQTHEGAGRNIGEACHIYDIFSYLTGSRPLSISAHAVGPNSEQWVKNDNFVATIRYEDGSVATLTYTSQGSKIFPKERMDLYVDGKVYYMDDYKKLEKYETKKQELYTASSPDKGHKEEMKAFISCFTQGREWPISLEDQVLATHISLCVEDQIQKDKI